jgi:uncharacterized protein YecT (DUF1311 family)
MLRVGLLVAAIVVISSAGNAVAASRLRAPRLPEKATSNSVDSFPCPRNPIATVDIEACQGHALLKLAHTFNQRVSVLWPLLDAEARRDFVRAHIAWLTYRNQGCRARAREEAGGTAEGVVFVQCQVELTRARVNEVSATLNDYCQGRARTGLYRRCPRP